VDNLFRADATLNLPHELQSNGLGELAAIESSAGSFKDAKDAITRATSVVVGQCQAEHCRAAGACDCH
jgi:hypothetical protein